MAGFLYIVTQLKRESLFMQNQLTKGNNAKQVRANSRSYQIKSLQWQQYVGCLSQTAMNLWPLIWCTLRRIAPLRPLMPLGLSLKTLLSVSAWRWKNQQKQNTYVSLPQLPWKANYSIHGIYYSWIVTVLRNLTNSQRLQNTLKLSSSIWSIRLQNINQIHRQRRLFELICKYAQSTH